MNWIIEKSQKMPYHTYLNVILAPFVDDLNNYQWLVSDFESNHTIGTPFNYEQDYFILSADDMRNIFNADIQIYWGVIIAVPIDVEVIITSNNDPYVEGNALVFKEGNIQYPGGEIEIICFDSSYTIVKFSKEELSNRFKVYFDEAIPLKKYTDKYIK